MPDTGHSPRADIHEVSRRWTDHNYAFLPSGDTRLHPPLPLLRILSLPRTPYTCHSYPTSRWPRGESNPIGLTLPPRRAVFQALCLRPLQPAAIARVSHTNTAREPPRNRTGFPRSRHQPTRLHITLGPIHTSQAVSASAARCDPATGTLVASSAPSVSLRQDTRPNAEITPRAPSMPGA